MKVEKTIGLNGSMLDEQPTGVGVYTYNIINQLFSLCQAEKWYRFTVFAPTNTFLNRNLRIVRLSRLLLSSKHGKWAAFFRFMWNTFYYPAKARNFDMLISPTTHGSFHLSNQIITIHDLLSLRYRDISFHQRLYFKFLLPRLVAKAKSIVTVSESTKKDIIHFLNYPEHKISVIYNGYDAEQYRVPDAKPNAILLNYNIRNYLLSVGPTYPHKNFERLLTVYNGLSEEMKSAHPLVIAGGKKQYLSTLVQQVKDLRLEPYVHFLGYVPQNLMAPLYQEALALVFPSLYEGFGFPLLEAMACGCPVVVSNASSMPEVCGDAAFYFNPLDNVSLKYAMEKIIGSEKIRRTLSQNGIVRAKQFSWEQSARKLKNLIDHQFQQS